MRKRVLFVSNGHGEDEIAICLLKTLKYLKPSWTIEGMPLVEGKAYRENCIGTIGYTRKMPSGGFVRYSLLNFIRDIKAGWWSMTKTQIRAVRERRDDYDLVVAVGDIYCLLFVILFLRKPTFFVSTLASQYYESKLWFVKYHGFLERLLMKRYCLKVYVRDELTAEFMCRKGLNAAFKGNVMMDCFTVNSKVKLSRNGEKVVGILPGSRDGAHENFQTILETLESFSYKGSVIFACALASGVEVERLKRPGWEFVVGSADHGLEGILRNGHAGREVYLYRGMFGNIINEARFVIGLAGTANEQAAGLGKPVINFYGAGFQGTRSFVNSQRRLLGETLIVLPPDPKLIASQMEILLEDDQLVQKLGRPGKERMGPKGGSQNIVSDMIETIGEE
jgi:uncharacterized protein (TIGR03492 family)